MGRLLLKSVASGEPENRWESNKIKAVLNVAVNLDQSTGLEQDVTIVRNNGRWYATVALDDFPGQESPEDAVEKLGKWLSALSKAIKGKNVKHLRLAEIFKAKHVK